MARHKSREVARRRFMCQLSKLINFYIDNKELLDVNFFVESVTKTVPNQFGWEATYEQKTQFKIIL